MQGMLFFTSSPTAVKELALASNQVTYSSAGRRSARLKSPESATAQFVPSTDVQASLPMTLNCALGSLIHIAITGEFTTVPVSEYEPLADAGPAPGAPTFDSENR